MAPPPARPAAPERMAALAARPAPTPQALLTPVMMHLPQQQPIRSEPAIAPAVLRSESFVTRIPPRGAPAAFVDAQTLAAVRAAGGSCPAPVYRLVWAAAAAFQLDPALVAALIEAESTCRPDAVSDAGARGLMQLMPEYGARVGYRLVHGLDRIPDDDSLRDPDTNIALGVAYLAALRDHFSYIDSEHARLLLVIASYNCGMDYLEQRLPDEARSWDAAQMAQWLRAHAPAETRGLLSVVMDTSLRYSDAVAAAHAQAQADTGRQIH